MARRNSVSAPDQSQSNTSFVHAVALDPTAQRAGRRPDRLLLSQLRQRRAGGVIDQIHQAALRTPLLVPQMKAAIHLHHLPKMLFPLSPTAVCPPLPFSRTEAAGTPPSARAERAFWGDGADGWQLSSVVRAAGS